MRRLRFRSGSLILVALLLCAASLALFAPDYFEDNRYNLGVARRSALPRAQHVLETSLNHLYFEAYPTVRAEDWHRGLSVLLLSFWARLFGESETWMRVPHLLWLAAWVSLQALLLKLIQPKAPMTLMLAGCLLFLLAYEDRSNVLRRAFTDDVPAAVFALAGVYVFLRDDKATLRAAALMGTLFGLAALCKDAFILMGLVGVELLGYGQWTTEERRGWKQLFVALTVFSVTFGLVLSPRFLWCFVDYGTFVQNPIQHWMVAHFYGTAYLAAEHYPYFLTGNTQYLSRVEMAGGVWEAIFLTLRGPLRETTHVLLSFSFLWYGFAAVWLLSRRFALGWRSVHGRLLGAFMISLSTFAVFFGLGFGEAQQLRYWIVQITLGLVLLVALFAELLPQVTRLYGLPIVGLCGLACALLYPVFVDGEIYRKMLDGRWLGVPDAPLSEAIMREVDARLGDGDAALMEIKPAIYYWSAHPEDRLVAFPSRLFRVIGREPTLRLVNLYNVRYAVLQARSPGSSTLESFGFVEILRRGDEVLFGYRGR